MRQLIVAILLALTGALVTQAAAQQPLRFTQQEQLTFRHLDILDGLSQNTVTSKLRRGRQRLRQELMGGGYFIGKEDLSAL